MTPLTILCWRWQPPLGYRSQFGPDTVRILRDMVRRHYAGAHRFVCVTDQPQDIPDIETIPLWHEHGDLPSPHGPRNPSCYRRLRMFAPDAADLFSARRWVSLDLDTVIVRDVTPLWDRPDDLVMWGDATNPTTHYNGSMMLMSAGVRPQVWTEFDPRRSPKQARDRGFFGSDQGWLSHCLGPHEAKWTKADGVYSYRNDIAKQGGRLPADARIVFFHGSVDPWDHRGQALPWVRQHYGEVVAA